MGRRSLVSLYGMSISVISITILLGSVLAFICITEFTNHRRIRQTMFLEGYGQARREGKCAWGSSSAEEATHMCRPWRQFECVDRSTGTSLNTYDITFKNVSCQRRGDIK